MLYGHPVRQIRNIRLGITSLDGVVTICLNCFSSRPAQFRGPTLLTIERVGSTRLHPVRIYYIIYGTSGFVNSLIDFILVYFRKCTIYNTHMLKNIF